MSFIVACFLVVFSLIAHEMGHWVVLTRLQVPVREWWAGLGPQLLRIGKLRVGMLPIGASVLPDPDRYATLSARAKMAVALGGPIGSAVYGMALLLAAQQVHIPIGRSGLETLAMMNFGIALFNMLPVPPLDGYHILESLFEHCNRPLGEKAKQMSYRMGNGLVYGIGFFFLGKLFW